MYAGLTTIPPLLQRAFIHAHNQKARRDLEHVNSALTLLGHIDRDNLPAEYSDPNDVIHIDERDGLRRLAQNDRNTPRNQQADERALSYFDQITEAPEWDFVRGYAADALLGCNIDAGQYEVEQIEARLERLKTLLKTFAPDDPDLPKYIARTALFGRSAAATKKSVPFSKNDFWTEERKAQWKQANFGQETLYLLQGLATDENLSAEAKMAIIEALPRLATSTKAPISVALTYISLVKLWPEVGKDAKENQIKQCFDDSLKRTITEWTSPEAIEKMLADHEPWESPYANLVKELNYHRPLTADQTNTLHNAHSVYEARRVIPDRTARLENARRALG